jgi:hypothetical protein
MPRRETGQSLKPKPSPKDTRHFDFPNRSAPLDAPIGAIEAFYEHCQSELRFVPDENGIAMLRPGEEMKSGEWIAVVIRLTTTNSN